jgi:hypothetical protein
MKKDRLNEFGKETPQYVIAHAQWRKSRGRRPTLSFRGICNPRKALALAKAVLAAEPRRDEYRRNLGRLPIVNPTWKDMALVCPHLTESQAIAAFNNGSGYVACPPLRIRNAFQIVSYRKETRESVQVWFGGRRISVGTEVRPARLDWAYASRTPASYADGKPHGDVFSAYKHMYEAIRYGEQNWGSLLILDSWKSVVEIIVQDPSQLVTQGYRRDTPITVAVLGVALNRDLNDIINDHSHPESQLFDDSVAELTLDRAVWNEIKGGRGGYTEFNCAYCGAGLGLSGCSGCGHKFHDDGFRSGWHTPLSKKMVAHLEQHGHSFQKHPLAEWKKEEDRFDGYRMQAMDYQMMKANSSRH